MKRAFYTIAAAGAIICLAPRARADAPDESDARAVASAEASAPTSEEVDALDRMHADSLATRRALANAVLIAGLVSIAGGAALIVPDAYDEGFRYAGINTAIFGVVNTIVGLRALSGIRDEERTWEASTVERRTPNGLARARMHAIIDERRESVGHAINLGLDVAYFGVGATAVVASRLGVDHPNRWLASGIAVGAEALFLGIIDCAGLRKSHAVHDALVGGLHPTVVVAPAHTGASEFRIGIASSF